MFPSAAYVGTISGGTYIFYSKKAIKGVPEYSKEVGTGVDYITYNEDSPWPLKVTHSTGHTQHFRAENIISIELYDSNYKDEPENEDD